MKIQSIEYGSELDEQAEELAQAFRKYREFLKRKYPDRLAGVIWIKAGFELFLYSESERYTNQITELTFDPKTDSFELLPKQESEGE